MIDQNGYRSNVGIVICNAQGQLFWARRIGQDAWQFPQGGVHEGEQLEDALFRELYEEVGLRRDNVEILARSEGWLRYRLPRRLVRNEVKPVCIGQKQKWFLLRLISDESHFCMNTTASPEFDGWQWVSYWYPLRQVVGFKREVYRAALREFAPYLLPQIKDTRKLDPLG